MWYWTLSTHEFTWIWSDINLMMGSVLCGLGISVPQSPHIGFFSIRLAIMHKKTSTIYQCNYPECKKYHWRGFPVFNSLSLNIHISVQNSHILPQPICDQMFSYTYLDYRFTYIHIHIWIVWYFFLHVSIVCVLWRWEYAVIYCKLVPDWIKSYACSIQIWEIYRSNTELNQNITWRSISK